MKQKSLALTVAVFPPEHVQPCYVRLAGAKYRDPDQTRSTSGCRPGRSSATNRAAAARCGSRTKRGCAGNRQKFAGPTGWARSRRKRGLPESSQTMLSKRSFNFTSDPFPLSAVILIDDDLPQKQADQVQKSLATISAGFGPNDEAALVTYSEYPDDRRRFFVEQ